MSQEQHNAAAKPGRWALCWRIARGTCFHLSRASRRALGLTFKLLLAAYFLFCALFLVLRYAVLPEIGHYKPQIERAASKAIGRAVTVDAIDAFWSGLRPQLALGNVTVHDEAGEPALTLPRVSTTLSWSSVLVAGLRLENLTIERADLAIRRDPAGKLFVAGIPVPTGGDGSTLDWLLSQREIVIRDSKLRWDDELRNAPELELDEVNLILHNSWLRHRLSLRAVPPASHAAPLDVRADFSHPAFASRISDVSRWKGTLYADLRRTDLSVWRAYFDYPIEIASGSGSVRAWLALDHAKVANFTADLGLSDFSARLSKKLEPLNLKRVNGRISASESLGATPEDGVPTFGANGHKVTLNDFSIEMPDGFVLPPTSVSESYEPATPLKAERTSVKATHLNLETLSQLAARLPLAPSQRKLLDDLAPRGELHDFTVQWQGTYPELTSYRVQGRFTGLGMQALARHVEPVRSSALQQAAPAQWAGMPGFDNISGEIDADEKGGSVRLDSEKLAVQLPAHLFSEPSMPFDSMKLRAHWQYQKDQTLLIELDDMQFAQPGVAGRLRGRHVLPLQGKSAGTADFTGEISSFDFKTIHRYLPQHISEPLRRWLTQGLVDGTAHDVQLTLKGPLADFPFHAAGDKARGQFLVSGEFDGLKLNYTPGHLNKEGVEPEWPLLEQGRGRFSFERGALEVKADDARSLGAKLAPVSARIADLESHEAVLEIDGVATGPMSAFLQYVNQSPVARWTGNVMEQTSASGEGRLDLKFQMPLHHAIETRAQGAFQFANNDVDLLPTLPVLYRANGKVAFNERGFTLDGVRGNFLGDAVAITGGTQADGSNQVRLNGAVNIEALRKLYTEPSMQRLLARLSGGARYSASVLVRQHQRQPEVLIESSLAGLGSELPAPLKKAAQDSLPMRFELLPAPSSDPLLQREEIKVALGPNLGSRYLREKVAGNAEDWRLVNGGIALNQPVPSPASGLKLALSADSFDLDAWTAFKAEIVGTPGAGGAPQSKLGSSEITQYLEPDAVSARVGELTLAGKKLKLLSLDATHRKNSWQMNVDSQQASGTVTWDEPGAGRGPGKVTARLSSLVVPKGSAGDNAAGQAAQADGGASGDAQMPALDIRAEQFELAGKKLGRLELDANNMVTAVGREWRINRLLLANEDAQFRAAGNWMAFGSSNTSNITYALDINDAGKLLERFGYPGTIRGGKGKLDGDLSWKGLPYAMDMPSLSGQVHVDVHSGQFLKVDPGAAKLLGVLNLQALPRRLTLDFRDVFSEGFAFDNVVGTAAINRGIATTDNLKMTGVTASVLMNGSADIARETQDLHVVVIPEINLGTASVVAMAVNPVVGVGTLLAQLFLRNPVMKSLTFEYKVTGPWSDPIVVKQSQVSAVGSERAREVEGSGKALPAMPPLPAAAPAAPVAVPAQPAARRRDVGPVINSGA